MKYAEGNIEYADQRMRRLTTEQQKRFVRAWTQARESGKLTRTPMKIAVAKMLLDAATTQG